MRTKILCQILSLVPGLVLAAEDFSYFKNDINYWTPDKQTTSSITPEVEKQTKNKSTFNWSRYLNPQNDDFFKEGNYTPPAPFMELARNPSDQNIKNWITYNKTKNYLSQRLKDKMTAYMKVNNQGVNQEQARTLFEKKSQSLQSTAIDPSRYRIRMFFDSKCPHCDRMFGTLLDLQNSGIFVEALQVDDKPFDSLKYPIAIRRASTSEIKKHNVQSIPFTLIADLKKKALYPPIQGYQNADTVMQLLLESQNL